MGDEVKLYGVTGSPFSCRAEIALKLKGVKYELIEENLGNKSPELIRYNPVHKKVPVLLHNGKPIAESLVIIEYIDETWKGDHSILPEDPYERAMARFWARFLDDKALPLIRGTFGMKGEEQEKAIEEATTCLKMLEDQLSGKKFFGGDKIGLVDIAGDFIAYWLGVIQEVAEIEILTKEKCPKLCEWVDEYLNCSVVKESLPPRDHLARVFKARFGKA